jgi:hypothetical protein
MTGNSNSGRPKVISDQRARAILYSALAEPIGLVLCTNDTEKALRVLWMAKEGEPSLIDIKVLRSPLADGDIIVTNGDQRAVPALELEGAPEP